MRCIILGASEYFQTNIPLLDGDLVIAVDGGYLTARKMGINPDLHIGDMDSGQITENAIILPREKDDTDTLYAVKLALEKGCDEIIIYGGTAGRHDHTFANIQTLCYISKNKAKGYLVDKDVVYTAITDDTFIFPEANEGYVSVFSLSDFSYGVTIKGLKYELEDAVLKNDFPLGVSNEFTGKRASISVKKGTVLCIFPKVTGKY